MAITGVVAGGLYTVLGKFADADSLSQEDHMPVNTPVPARYSPSSTPPPRGVPSPGPTAVHESSPMLTPPPRPLVRPEPPAAPVAPYQPMTPEPDRVQPPTPLTPIPSNALYSGEFLTARKAIMKRGIEPEWGMFGGQELELLERAWKTYQKKLERKRRKKEKREKREKRYKQH